MKRLALLLLLTILPASALAQVQPPRPPIVTETVSDGAGYVRMPWRPPTVEELQCPGGVCPIPGTRPAPQGPTPQPANAAKIPAWIINATVRIGFVSGRAYQDGSSVKWGGSGVVYHVEGDKAIIVTNKHVAPERGLAITAYWPDGTNCPCEFIGADDKADLACLCVPAKPGMNFVPVAPQVGKVNEAIWQSGYPHGQGPTKKAGTLRGWSGMTDTTGAKLGTAALWVDPGDSGSGLFTCQEGRLCGLVCAKPDNNDRSTTIYVAWEDLRRFTEVCCGKLRSGLAPAPKQPTPPGTFPRPPVEPTQPLQPAPPAGEPQWSLDLKASMAAEKKAFADVQAKVAAFDAKPVIAGPPGKDGRDGLDGKPGRDGKDGFNGVNGTDGLPGRDGKAADAKTAADAAKALDVASKVDAATTPAQAIGAALPWAIGATGIGTPVALLLSAIALFRGRKNTATAVLPTKAGVDAAPGPQHPPADGSPPPKTRTRIEEVT